MKKLIVNAHYKFALLFIAIMGSVSSFAQDGSSTTSQSSTTQSTSSTAPVVADATAWYMQPWAWGLGILILIILIYAIMKGSSNKTVSQTTVTRTTDTNV